MLLLEEHLPIKIAPLVGTCVDVFHKDPARIRQILGDPGNLPHTAVIDVAGEKLDLKIDAIHDRAGEYIGARANWSVRTEQINLATAVKEVVESVAPAASGTGGAAPGTSGGMEREELPGRDQGLRESRLRTERAAAARAARFRNLRRPVGSIASDRVAKA